MPAKVFHAHLWGTREHKYRQLRGNDITSTDWVVLAPGSSFYLFVQQDTQLASEYERFAKVTSIFPINNIAMQTHRDYFVTDMVRAALAARITELRATDLSDDEVRARFDLGNLDVHEVRKLVRKDKAWDARFVPLLWRPFDLRWLYYEKALIDRPRPQVTDVLLRRNVALLAMRQIALHGGCSHFLATDVPAIDRVFYSNKGAASVFPLYDYQASQAGHLLPPAWPRSQEGRCPNLAPDFVHGWAEGLGLTFVSDGVGDLAETFGPEDVFHYIYAVFHAPTYRERYAEFLKIDFPRVPLTSDLELFRALCGLGADLVALHLLEDDYAHASWTREGQPCPLVSPITRYPVPGDNTVAKGHPKYLAPGEPAPGTEDPLPEGRVYMSKDDRRAGTQGQYFEGVPPEVWAFHIGGYQVCGKWLKDRRGRQLSYEDLTHYQRVVVALRETIRLMSEIDAAIAAHGGWPIE